jgi:predicted aspartyl protease
LRLVAQGTLTANDYLGKGNYQIADGSTHTFPNYRLRSVTVGGRTATNVRCSVGDDDHTLLLGQSFLKNFSSYTIDNTRNVLVLND